uniref:V-type proton ATPase subunit G n=1 Tax=Anthurium amnicola TaxID=1678845 RepID=A0A1D1ZME8_9ARAE
MDSIRGQSGIQMLLTAEQEAQQILSSARSMKMTRLKQAKDEADQEAAAYRASLEREYQRKVSEGSGDSSWNVKRLEEETNHKIQGLKDATSSVSSEVVSMLMKQITTIKA